MNPCCELVGFYSNHLVSFFIVSVKSNIPSKDKVTEIEKKSRMAIMRRPIAKPVLMPYMGVYFKTMENISA